MHFNVRRFYSSTGDVSDSKKLIAAFRNAHLKFRQWIVLTAVIFVHFFFMFKNIARFHIMRKSGNLSVRKISRRK